MIKKNKVSLWLGFFENKEEFIKYMNIGFDEDGNYVKSKFQEDYGIEKYDMDLIETDWIEDVATDVETLLAGFSYDFKIIPEFDIELKKLDISRYNSIILLYDFEYDNNKKNVNNMNYITCVNY